MMRVPKAELAPGVRIPRIVNGCWQLASDHRREARRREETLETLAGLAELGLTAFDGADIYTGVEETLGAFRRCIVDRGGNPGALRFHTKFVPDLGMLAEVDAAYVEHIIHRSRQRLGVEKLDLVQFHWWDFEIPGWVETARHLGALEAVDLLGVTNFDVEHLRPIVESGVEMVSNQVQYSLLDRRPAREMAEFCGRNGIVLLAYGALAGGFLTDRWLGKSDPGLEVANRSLVKYRLIIEEYGGWEAFQELLATLDRIASKRRVTIAAVALRWVLDQPEVAAAISGVSSVARARENLRAFALEFDREDREQIEAQLAGHPGPPGDVYSIERIPGGRHAAIMKTELNR